MKKIFALVLALVMVVCLAACGSDKVETTDTKPENDKIGVETVIDEQENSAEQTENELESKQDLTQSETVKDNSQVSDKTQNNIQQPSKNDTKPAEKPAEKPVEKPVETPTETTLGTILLADFNKKASSNMSAEQIANELLSNPAIKFMGGAMLVEEGLLSGFDNAEIKGFDEGYMFAPMIGSIPFVGYVFDLSDGVDSNAFVSTLKQNANKRWNICVEADEMVTGSYGNKVFFVMCPKSLEE